MATHAYLNSVTVAAHQAILQSESEAVGQETVTLHLTQADATTNFTAFDRLAQNRIETTLGTNLPWKNKEKKHR